jgi:hypothetical protein
MSLEKELATYHEKLSALRADSGKWVLIKGDEIVDTFSAYEDALKRGYQDFGLEPFLVKRINAHEEAQMVTRLLAPAVAAPC